MNIVVLIFLFFKTHSINKIKNLSQSANTQFLNAKTKYIKLSFNVNLSKKWNIAVKLYALFCTVLLCYLQLSVLSAWLLLGSFFIVLPTNKQILYAHIVFFALLYVYTYWEKKQKEKSRVCNADNSSSVNDQKTNSKENQGDIVKKGSAVFCGNDRSQNNTPEPASGNIASNNQRQDHRDANLYGDGVTANPFANNSQHDSTPDNRRSNNQHQDHHDANLYENGITKHSFGDSSHRGRSASQPNPCNQSELTQNMFDSKESNVLNCVDSDSHARQLVESAAVKLGAHFQS